MTPDHAVGFAVGALAGSMLWAATYALAAKFFGGDR